MTKKFLFAAPLAITVAAMLASPASAAGPTSSGQIRAEIQQLDRQVERMRLAPREEKRLENQVDRLQSLYRDFARGGFSRSELQRLDRELTAVKAQVRQHSVSPRPAPGRDDRRDHNDRDDRRDHRR